MSGPMDPEAIVKLRLNAANYMLEFPNNYGGTLIWDLMEALDGESKRADAAEAALETSRRLLHAKGGGLRGLLDDAEAGRDELRAKLIEVMGVEAFEEWEEIPY